MSDVQSTVGPSKLTPRRPEEPPSRRSSVRESLLPLLQRISLSRYLGVLVALIAVVIWLSVSQPAFLTWSNFRNIVGANSVIFTIAMGATLVVITAAIDLSAASLMTASSMIFAITLVSNGNIAFAIFAAVAFGAVGGLANGILITKAKISFLVVTLGALSIWQSFALIVKSGNTVALFGITSFSPIREFVDGRIGPIPILLVFDIALLLVFGGVQRYTRFGRALFAIGSNTEAARLSGINVNRVLIAVYTIAGLTVGISCLISVGRLTAGSPTVESTLLLTELAAVLIGGTSFSGGLGGVLGTAVGVLFLGVVQNGLVLSNVSSYWQGTVSGGFLIVAVGIGVLRERGWTLTHLRSARAVSETADTDQPGATNDDAAIPAQ